MNNQKLRIKRIERMADKKFGRHKCPNNNQKLRIARIARIFNDKIISMIKLEGTSAQIVTDSSRRQPSVPIGRLRPKIFGKQYL